MEAAQKTDWRPRVALTQDLIRIANLPRRTWTPEEAQALADQMTQHLRTPNGQMRLFPVQAVALFELATVGGLFAPIPVGGGKSLASLLAPTVLQRVRGTGFRPLLIVPASLIKKTERDMQMLAEHWQIARFLKIMSYEYLGRAQAAQALEEFQPDLMFLDECHRAKNKRSAAVARRLTRFFAQHPGVVCAAASGTITTRSVQDYAHILRWCLPAAQTPVPLHFADLEMWSAALDERRGFDGRADPGELKILCNAEEQKLWGREPRKAARLAFRRRLIETPGVVAAHESRVGASLVIRAVRPKVAPVVDEAFKKLRLWETPDGWPIPDGLTMARHARELVMGFYYIWNPRPPREWLEPRRLWCKFVREKLKHSRTLDSELQVRQWAESIPFCEELQAWLEVKDSFEPNTEPVWLDTSTLDFAADWAHKNKGIIWTEHQCVGERLARDYGLPYYGKKGLDSAGRFIDDHPANQSLVASVASNGTGRNLQKWANNLVLGLPPNGALDEQLLGRTHRPGQESDEVNFDVVITCAEHLEGLMQAKRDARYIEHTTGSPQKLLLATIDLPPDFFVGTGPRWQK